MILHFGLWFGLGLGLGLGNYIMGVEIQVCITHKTVKLPNSKVSGLIFLYNVFTLVNSSQCYQLLAVCTNMSTNLFKN